MIDRISESNSNTGLYAAGAAVVGGGAGAAAGWYSRPFLKKGEPTDEYVNTAAKKIVKALPEEFTTNLKSVVDKFNNAKSTGELRTMLTDSIKALYKDIDFEKAKGYLKNTNDNLSLFGLKTFEAEDIANVKNNDDIAELFGKLFDKTFEGKSLEQVKTAIKENCSTMKKSAIKGIFSLLWDPDKKKFISEMANFEGYKGLLENLNPQIKEIMENAANVSEKLTKSFTDAANSIKGKYAAIYGAVGTAVLGLGTLLCLGSKQTEQIQDIEADENLAADADDIQSAEESKEEKED